MKFKKGDRVRLRRDVCAAMEGMVGTVMKDEQGDTSVPVEFDEEFPGGHNCNGNTANLHGHWIFPEDLELLDQPHAFTLVITSKGDHTEAKFLRGKEIIKTAEVNRFRDDEYSQPAAIHAIVDKMFPKDAAGITRDEPEEPPKFTGKAVSLYTDDRFTKGRIYNFDKGFVFENDKAFVFEDRDAPDDYDEWKEWFDDRFVALVEPENKA